MMPPTHQDVVAALRWHMDMGIAEPISEHAMHHAAATEEEAHPAPERNVAAIPARISHGNQASAPANTGLNAALASARQHADHANTLETLLQSIHAFDGCALKKTARNTVTHEGVWHSPVMFIGEAPGAEEDRNGVPFCGASGQLLDTMIGHIGLSRQENCLISNSIYWRPPGNRQPTPEELAICQPFVEKMIALNAPKILVAVGGTAVKALLGETRGITKLRGEILSYTNPYIPNPLPVHILLHPAYLLRQPMAKKQSWQDMLGLKSAIQSLS
jgi:uracil-DNA glycosylase family 4